MFRTLNCIRNTNHYIFTQHFFIIIEVVFNPNSNKHRSLLEYTIPDPNQ